MEQRPRLAAKTLLRRSPHRRSCKVEDFGQAAAKERLPRTAKAAAKLRACLSMEEEPAGGPPASVHAALPGEPRMRDWMGDWMDRMEFFEPWAPLGNDLRGDSGSD